MHEHCRIAVGNVASPTRLPIRHPRTHSRPCLHPRRRPFLIRGLENTMIKLLLSAEFFDDSNRRKLGIGEQLGLRGQRRRRGGRQFWMVQHQRRHGARA